MVYLNDLIPYCLGPSHRSLTHILPRKPPLRPELPYGLQKSPRTVASEYFIARSPPAQAGSTDRYCSSKRQQKGLESGQLIGSLKEKGGELPFHSARYPALSGVATIKKDNG